MKRLIENKELWKKLLISICIVSTLTCSVPVYSKAWDGGIVADALTQFLASLCDLAVEICQRFLVDGQYTASDGHNFMVDAEKFALGKEDSLPPELAEFKRNDAKGTTTEEIDISELKKFKIPVIKYTPDKIFAGKIPALDVNFISPKKWEEPEQGGGTEYTPSYSMKNWEEAAEIAGGKWTRDYINQVKTNRSVWEAIDIYDDYYTEARTQFNESTVEIQQMLNDVNTKLKEGHREEPEQGGGTEYSKEYIDAKNAWEKYNNDVNDVLNKVNLDRKNANPSLQPLRTWQEAAKVEGWDDFNILSHEQTLEYYKNIMNKEAKKAEKNTPNKEKRSITIQLHETIAKWYVSLRNLTLVALMIILLYIGIRIIISSTASDKAKYKKMLGDWVIALCLLVTMHYIMAFINMFIDEISSKVLSSGNEYGNNIHVKLSDGSGVKYEFNTDLMGLVRFKTQIPGQRMIFLVFYLALVIYTMFVFTFKYLKRVIDIAFLTMFAPVMVLTYPIDKMKDGKAQAYNSWFKEYVFLSLIQPFHLIIYTVFVSSSIELAVTNPIYAIVVLASLVPAEKLLRKFFGFDNSSMSSAVGGFAGGAAAMAFAQKAFSGKKSQGGNSGGKKTDDIRQKDGSFTKEKAPGIEALPQDSGNEGIRNIVGSESEGEIPSLGGTIDNSGKEGNSVEQRMVDAYDENYDSNTWDAEERDQMARKAGKPNNGQELNGEELGEMLREQGWSDEDIANTMKDDPRYSNYLNNKTSNQVENSKKRNIKKSAGVSALWQTYKRPLGKGALKVGRGLGRALGTGAGAAFGLAAGITGGNYSDIFKYTAAGATMGYGAAGKAMDSGSGMVKGAINMSKGIGRMEDVYKTGTGASTIEARYERQKKEFIKSKGRDLAEKYRSKGLSEEQVKANVDYAAQLNNYRFDEKTIEKTISLRDKYMKTMSRELAEKKAAAVAKERKDYGIENRGAALKQKDLIIKDLRDRGISEQMAKSFFNDMAGF